MITKERLAEIRRALPPKGRYGPLWDELLDDVDARIAQPTWPSGWWLVFPGGETLDLGPKRAVACFEFRDHAQHLIDRLWPGFGYLERVE